MMGAESLWSGIKRAMLGGESPIDKGLKGMAKLAEIMSKQFPAIIKNMSKASGDDPKKVERSVKAIVAILEAMKPMIDMASEFGKFATQFTKNYQSNKSAVNNPNLAKGMDVVTGAINTVLNSVGTFITNMTTSIGRIDKKSVRKLKAVGPLLTAIGSIFNSVTAPMAAIMNSAQETFQKQHVMYEKQYRTGRARGGGLHHRQIGMKRTNLFLDNVVFNTEKAEEMFGMVESAIPKYLGALGGGLKKTINAIKGISLSKGELTNLKNLGKYVAPLIETISGMLDIFGTLGELPEKLGLKKGQFLEALKGMDKLKKFMFGAKTDVASGQRGVEGFVNMKGTGKLETGGTHRGMMAVMAEFLVGMFAGFEALDKTVPKAFKKKGGMKGIKAIAAAIGSLTSIIGAVTSLLSNPIFSSSLLGGSSSGRAAMGGSITAGAKMISGSRAIGSAGTRTVKNMKPSALLTSAALFKKVLDLLQSPELIGLVKAAGSFTFKNGFPKDQDFVDSQTKLMIASSNINSLGSMVKEVNNIEVNLAKIKSFYTAITDIKNIVAEAGNIQEVKPFLGGGGTITVLHKHSNVEVSVNVNIDAEKITQKVLETKKVLKGPFAQKRAAARPGVK